ncbi:MAG: NADPH-dependent F420 reductase [Hyphomicrobiaceae bacterium]|nr:NADPH-dependent F420 reductase [Hyphomicrobiaceae bacterium]
MKEDRPTLAVIGGTGNLGHALAERWAAAGYEVIVGSRSAERAEEAAAQLSGVGGAEPRGLANEAAAEEADIVVLAVPFASQTKILQAIANAVGDKLVVDTTVPLVPPKVARAQMPEAGSAAMMARCALGDGARIVSAFHNVAAHKLKQEGDVDCDVLVFGDDPADRKIVIGLAGAIGLRGVHCGVLANSVAAEALTSILIGINKRYKADGAGIRITGLPSV